MEARRTKSGPQIEEQEKERYKDFDSKCDVVCSAPTCFWWAGDNLCLYGVPAVVQKLPYRTRVGVKKRPGDPGVKFVEYLSCDPIIGKLDNIYRDVRPVERMERWLTTWLKSRDISDGLDIHVIVETYPGRAPASPTLTGSRSAALAGCVALLYLGITREQINAWKAERSHYFKVGANNPGTELFRLAWNLTACGHSESMNMSGADTYCALVTGAEPALYFTEDRSAVGAQVPLFSLDEANTPYDQTWAGGVVLGDSHSKGLGWELDYALIYSGQPKVGDNAIDAFLNVSPSIDARARFVESRINSLGPREEGKVPLTSSLGPRGGKMWRNGILTYGSYLSSGIAYSIDKVLKGEDPSVASVELGRYVNEYQALLRNLGLSHSLPDQLVDDFQQFWRTQGLEAGIKLSGYGRGGGLLLVCPERNLRPRFQTLLGRFADITSRAGVEPDRGIRVEFASWIHGYSYLLRQQEKDGVDEEHGEGLAVIHFPEADITSPLLKTHRVAPRQERNYMVSINGGQPEDRDESDIAALCARSAGFDFVYHEPKGILYCQGVERARWDIETQKHHLLIHMMLRPGQVLQESKLNTLMTSTYASPAVPRSVVAQLKKDFPVLKDNLLTARKARRLSEGMNVAVVFGKDSKFLSTFL